MFISLAFVKLPTTDRFFEPPPSKTDFDTLAGILRLSTKYEILYLRQRALRHLDTTVCNTLQDQEARQSKRTIPRTDFLSFLIAELAHEMDLPWLLPPVLCSCTLFFEDIVTGYMYKGERRWMNSSQQVVCIKALKPLIDWYRKDILSFLYWTNVDGCKSSARCNQGRLKLLEGYSSNELSIAFEPFPNIFEQDVRKAVCTTCCIASRDAHLAASDALWEALPGLFDLPSWGTLRTLRRQALTESWVVREFDMASVCVFLPLVFDLSIHP